MGKTVRAELASAIADSILTAKVEVARNKASLAHFPSPGRLILGPDGRIRCWVNAQWLRSGDGHIKWLFDLDQGGLQPPDSVGYRGHDLLVLRLDGRKYYIRLKGTTEPRLSDTIRFFIPHHASPLVITRLAIVIYKSSKEAKEQGKVWYLLLSGESLDGNSENEKRPPSG